MKTPKKSKIKKGTNKCAIGRVGRTMSDPLVIQFGPLGLFGREYQEQLENLRVKRLSRATFFLSAVVKL